MIFQKRYFIFTVLLFIIEVFIALFFKDRIIRPYVGDFLVVILLYCFLKSFFKISVLKAALAVLLFAYLIEFLQYLNIVKYLGLEKSRLANIIIGNSFEWIDMLAYTLGTIVIIIVERKRQTKNYE